MAALARPPVGNVDDLASLARLDEKALLGELETRYNNDVIYTYVGDILVAVNPFKTLPIFDKKHAAKYRKVVKSQVPPHIYYVADATYQMMQETGRNQCCVISGESGAGKTESAKYVIKQLIELCHGKTSLEQKIIQVNPLLEAFGNAQTIMNDNSSRFGKYIQLKFRQGQVLGAKINEYLLEKSRVVRQAPYERNFHIFYYLFCGLDEEDQAKYCLGDASDKRYLSNGAGPLRTHKAELTKGYGELEAAMDLVGFEATEQENLYVALGGILNLGNVEFEGDSDKSMVKDPELALKNAAVLFGLDPMQLADTMTVSMTVARGEQIRRNLGVHKAEDARDAIAKVIYSRLFSWIVNRINSLLAPPVAVKQSEIFEIGILDIFGFEKFDHNSFEQICINLANEQLQFFFNQHIFTLELEEYKREGISAADVKFSDNKLILSFFLQKPIGLLALLDEDCFFPKASDLSFLEKLTKNFKKLDFFERAKDTSSTFFAVQHYAGKVDYDTDGFLEKNRDTLPSGVTEMLQISKNSLLNTIFRGTITRTGTLALQSRRAVDHKSRMKSRAVRGARGAPAGKSTKKSMTVGSQFKSSLEVLMEKMNAARPHFIRCIKPNKAKASNCFEDDYVEAQLRYTGMLETIRIRREGFAVRPTFEEFFFRFHTLAKKKVTKSSAENCRVILQGTGLREWQIGKTKVFLKYWHVEKLSELLEKVHSAATHLQRIARGFIARRRFKKLLADGRRQAGLVADFLEYLPNGGTRIKDRVVKLIVADKARPKDYFNPKQAAPAVALPPPPQATLPSDADLPPPPPEDEDEDDSEDEIDDFDEVIPKRADNKNKRFGRMGTKAASVRWFKETQKAVAMQSDGRFHEWFHGIITRRDAEQLLTDKPIGCFLVRVSESRFGYSLSFRVATRCKHYMIDQTPSGKFIVVGEPKVHKNLAALVKYYQQNQVNEDGDILTIPCGQAHGQLDYADLLEEEEMRGMGSMSARGRPVSSDFSRPGGRSPIQVRRSAARPPSSGQVSSRQQAHHAGSRAGGSHMKAALSPSGGAPPPLPPR
ncbi:myosin-IIIb-like [Corticium candelabrum]|uniref:myosin-IIIb-like n=1 Tax=Corticium candelabrum TaxID=121492 RepID=UPI002E26BB45|nr:myosin-IIIb-like [Corticium candelabrum]